jgi:hypothetical protein
MAKAQTIIKPRVELRSDRIFSSRTVLCITRLVSTTRCHKTPIPVAARSKGRYTLVTFPSTVLWQCGRDSWSRNVSKVGYAVTLRACSVCCRYLAVPSKGWYGYGLSRWGRTTWQVTTVRSSRLLYIHDCSGSRNKLGTPWCNARRILLRH